jgi:hypothetical protein
VRYLDGLSDVPVVLEGPKQIVRGDRITHLRYRIVK